ncbi:hypothetical protein FB45DRAFT_557108 [Roridomyces roridus]|uniref:DUF423-domain-containing protein n=1 Tax=Roridomyces roridus TaxID=1738132 RepID=A0AAD7FLT6_9AGAR|nr:hypothetical protein FB45DRAFT_557108 [Roridomyces roridus]
MPPTPELLWRTGSALAAGGIISGAFGAHGLKARGVAPDSIASFQTASHYMVFNGLALLLVSMHPRFSVHRFAGPAIFAGTTLFSGSIFALVLNRDRFRFLGPVTPLGGLTMIAGYISMIF